MGMQKKIEFMLYYSGYYLSSQLVKKKEWNILNSCSQGWLKRNSLINP